ncbi:MAG: MAPEG family protein [Proteobacteria bacterium]|nr:MAPEG family protein [Pseudomonadota bacterium]MDA1059122.1 MAPEG family protein [Pseudomonadota bacterium]
MTVELWYLFAASVLLAMLWIPHIVGQVVTKGLLTPDDYRNLRTEEGLPNWVRRANRAHINLVEQFGAFAGIVLVAHLAGISNELTQICAAVFVWARVVHAVIFIAGVTVAMARTLVFTAAWAALVVYAVQILVSAA